MLFSSGKRARNVESRFGTEARLERRPSLDKASYYPPPQFDDHRIGSILRDEKCLRRLIVQEIYEVCGDLYPDSHERDVILGAIRQMCGPFQSVAKNGSGFYDWWYDKARKKHKGTCVSDIERARLHPKEWGVSREALPGIVRPPRLRRVPPPLRQSDSLPETHMGSTASPAMMPACPPMQAPPCTVNYASWRDDGGVMLTPDAAPFVQRATAGVFTPNCASATADSRVPAMTNVVQQQPVEQDILPRDADNCNLEDVYANIHTMEAAKAKLIAQKKDDRMRARQEKIAAKAAEKAANKAAAAKDKQNKRSRTDKENNSVQELSAYEQQRRKNMQENEQVLNQMGLLACTIKFKKGMKFHIPHEAFPDEDPPANGEYWVGVFTHTKQGGLEDVGIRVDETGEVFSQPKVVAAKWLVV
ncbi:hypothetical protein AB1Y20_021021 [Prymnesium parvum]|uniref:Uncharacterized protein n=1 Tax=Prymnesium parvum TaxID=97485 RepID=A0AB34JHJ1_PRYPA